jgi:hypothetical protein
MSANGWIEDASMMGRHAASAVAQHAGVVWRKAASEKRPTSEQLLLESSLEQTSVLLSLLCRASCWLDAWMDAVCGCWGEAEGSHSGQHQSKVKWTTLTTTKWTRFITTLHCIRKYHSYDVCSMNSSSLQRWVPMSNPDDAASACSFHIRSSMFMFGEQCTATGSSKRTLTQRKATL